MWARRQGGIAVVRLRSGLKRGPGTDTVLSPRDREGGVQGLHAGACHPVRPEAAALGVTVIRAARVLLGKKDRVRSAVRERGWNAGAAVHVPELPVLVHLTEHLGVAGIRA